MFSEFLLAWVHVKRYTLRTFLLVLSICCGFLIFGVLGTLNFSLSGGSDSFTQSRLMVLSQAGLVEPLPISYQQRIAAIEGVKSVGHATWFGLQYQDEEHDLMSFAVDGPMWLEQHPETQIDQAAIENFNRNRDGLLVNEHIARRFGWQVGDRIPLKSILFQPKNGEQHWSFVISGLFTTSDASGGRKYVLAHYDYLNEGRLIWKNTVGSYIVVPEEGVVANELATQIDDFFLRTDKPTYTATDKAFHDDFFKQFGDVFFIIKSVVSISFISVVLVVASTIALTVRQRTRDIGVLKCMGYSNGKIFRLIYLETSILVVLGCVVGLLGAFSVNKVMIFYWPIVPDINLPLFVLAEAALVVITLVAVSGVIPATIALKLKPIEAFKINE